MKKISMIVAAVAFFAASANAADVKPATTETTTKSVEATKAVETAKPVEAKAKKVSKKVVAPATDAAKPAETK